MARTMATKRRAADSDNSEAEVAPKSAKRVKSASSSKSAGAKGGSDGKDDDGNPFWELSSKRRIGISEFKTNTYVNIREFYEKDGKHLPTKKGISLSIEQYNLLLKAIPAINATLRKDGHNIEYAEDVSEAAPAPAAKPKKEKKKPSKANIEATSDEEEEKAEVEEEDDEESDD
ncbi:rna polymerase ii transcriptional coactivator [Fusarium albosuccineum]|uniref:Rna polymerase ii transcriptional coactivator n=1 Tax=Fusarium albosuccineum TaxID=1237068 RepID=A0A8H4LLH7_9HYPO|nr:rna polymerase ii transcriptional coactivator [Fusarium albosuccineum]